MRFLIFITTLTVLYLVTAFLVWDINLFSYLERSLGYRLIGLSFIAAAFSVSMIGFGDEHPEDYP